MLILHNYRRLAVYLFVGVWVALGVGCRFPWPVEPKSIDSAPSPAALKAYRAAVVKFREGDYDASAKQFSEIRDTTSDQRLARMALFGLALSQLVVAETPEAYEQALQLWQNWVNIAPDIEDSENAALLDPIIRDKMLLANIPATSDNLEIQTPEATVSNLLFVRTKQEMDRLREQLETSEANLKKGQAKIQSLKKEIGRLKRQIKAMEAIDQKIQKKKNAIPSAD